VYGEDLAAAFQERNIVHDRNASWRVIAWAYEQAQSAGSRVWRQGDELVELAPSWKALLAQATL
jgi:hypothetical protein